MFVHVHFRIGSIPGRGSWNQIRITGTSLCRQCSFHYHYNDETGARLYSFHLNHTDFGTVTHPLDWIRRIREYPVNAVYFAAATTPRPHGSADRSNVINSLARFVLG